MNRYTLITGASEGLGKEFATIYAKESKNLILVARNKEKLSKLQNQLEKYNVDIHIVSLDLTVDKSCEELKEYVDKNNLNVDRLINNAGIGSFGYFDSYSDNLIQNLIDLNIKTVSTMIRLFIKDMIKNECGEILNISSTAAFSAGPKMSIYYASKAYVLSLSESLHEEYKDKNIKISCLCPGAFKTKFQKKSGIKKDKSAEKLLMDVEAVAKEGVKGLKRGQAIIIPGYKNKLTIILNKFIPRLVARKIILRMNKS